MPVPELPTCLTLEAGSLRLEVVPALGGGVFRFWSTEGEGRAIFRPPRRPSPQSAGDLGMVVLAPWSNRISGGGFTWDGRFHPVPANVAGERCAIHGNAWLAPWTVPVRRARSVVLALGSDGPGPFIYDARLGYTLAPEGLATTLCLTHQGPGRVPYGVGFHPWFPRLPQTRLQAPARGVWLENAQHLPERFVAIAEQPDWNFVEPAALPATWVNNGFTGWSGCAAILSAGLRLDIDCSPALRTYLLYSPGAQANFFCFEPVSHVVDAHNLGADTDAHGLRTLERGQSLNATCLLSVSLTDTARVRAGPA